MKLNKIKSKPIIQRILFPMLFLVFLEILLLAGSVYGGKVIEKLNQNEKDILKERVLNRKNYLENEMNRNWSDVELTVGNVTKKAEQLAQEGIIDPMQLSESSSQCMPLLEAIQDDLIAMLRSNGTTGAFVVFNSSDLKEDMKNQTFHDKTGLYIRDDDPGSGTSVLNSDLMLEYAPIAMVHQMNIPTDNNWQPILAFGKNQEAYYPFLYEPFQQAYDHTIEGTYHDFGYWSAPYTLYGDDVPVISYSVPLMLKDGTVYGILGVEISLSYIQKILPYKEIIYKGQGSYLLGIDKGEHLEFEHVVISGPMYKQSAVNKQKSTFEKEKSGYTIPARDAKDPFYASIQYLDLYNSNTPFVDQKWALSGIVELENLTAFGQEITQIFKAAIFITLFVGVVGSILLCAFVTNPVKKLAAEMSQTAADQQIHLQRTRIKEIDQMIDEVEELSHNVINSAAKFSKILKLASVEIAGFEVDYEKKSVFLTELFCGMLGLPGQKEDLSVQDVDQIFDSLKKEFLYEETDEQNYILQLTSEDGIKYIRITAISDDSRRIGLIENITQTIMEKESIEHERDYDLLTGLMNRRAFQRCVKRLFSSEIDVLKTAALVMLDLDNLKSINDNYGHDCGDRYIIQAADSFRQFVPPDVVVARMAGDEFYIFFYGYDSQDAIREVLHCLEQGINSQIFLLPTMEQRQIGVSGGIAWYPKDTTTYEGLLKYSDFAMYQVKTSMKGKMKDFDLGIYNKEMYLIQSITELKEMIREQLVTYHLQPIVDAGTGKIFAYEALLRVNLPTLQNPMEVLKLAEQEGCLQDIECLTWEKAMEKYVYCVENGQIAPDSKIFINSLADYIMPKETVERFAEKYSGYLSSIVLEVTEEGKIDQEAIEIKRKYLTSWGAQVALDDYGSGYNGDQVLLNLSPRYVKVDMSIIRNIHLDADKQTLVKHLVAYGHERNIFIVAEGIEKKEEMEQVIKLGVDYLQGYYLGKPQKEPVRECHVL